MKSWQQIIRGSFTHTDKVADFLGLSPENRALLWEKPPFPFLLPRRLAEKIPQNSLDDPLAKQFLPLKEESISYSGFQLDPTGEEEARKCPMLIQKYQKRALLTPTGSCAMHCRYCFRQNFSYQSSPDLSRELAYLKQDASLKEVILSGGDPLSLPDRRLEALLEEIEKVAHIEIIRFHSRFIVGVPERVTEKFLAILAKCRKQIIFVVHTNHIHELDGDIYSALKQIGSLGIPLLSQSVLLRGVNDDVNSLEALFLALIARGVMPYYLHQLDRVRGTHHFDVSEERGLALIEALRERLPGYAVPRYVREIPQEKSKTPVTPKKEALLPV